MRAGYWSERSLRSYGCSYFSSDCFGDAVISVVERFQESAKQEEAAFHKLLSRRTHISGAAKREQPKHLSRAWLFMLPHLNNGDTGSALNRSLQSVKWVWGPLLLLLWKLRWRILTPVGSGQWGPPRSSQHLFLRCPSPFGVLRGPFCQLCHRVCFRAQRSPASAYLKVHPETLWPWNARPLRGGFSERSVHMLPVGMLFQDVVLTAQLDRVWLIVLPHLSMGTREACSTAAFEV